MGIGGYADPYQHFASWVRRQKEVGESLKSPEAFIARYYPQMKYLAWYREADKIIEPALYGAILAPPRSGKTWRYGVVGAIMHICEQRYNMRHGLPYVTPQVGIISKAKRKAEYMMTTIKKFCERPDVERDFGPFRDRTQRLAWSNTELRFVGSDETESTPNVVNLGASSMIESLGFTFMVIDDIVDKETSFSERETTKAWERFEETYMTRRQTESAIVRVIGHRFTANDFYNRILQDPRFTASEIMPGAIFSMPALNAQNESNIPELWSTGAYLHERSVRRVQSWEPIYQQNPTAIEGGFDINWMLDRLVVEKPAGIVTAHFDPAYSTSESRDYTGGVAVMEYAGNMIVVGLYKQRIAVGHAKEFIAFKERHGAAWMTVEDNNAKTLPGEIRDRGHDCRAYSAHANKLDRISSLAEPLEEGRIRFWEPLRHTPEWSPLVEEVGFFPLGGHEHILDALHQAWVNRSGRGRRARAKAKGN